MIRVGAGDAREVLRYLPTATDRETDPTGAGDTFLAALLASVLRPAIVGRPRSRRSPDLRFAAAAGSLAVEEPGLDRRAGSCRGPRPAGEGTHPARGRPERANHRSARSIRSAVGGSAGGSADRSEPMTQPGRATQQVGLQGRLRATEPTAALDGIEAMDDRLQRARSIAQPVLADLGEFDGCHDGDPARTGRERGPGLVGLGMPAQPAQQVGAIDRDPLGRPGRGERGSSGHDRGDGRPLLPTTEVGGATRRPPRGVIGAAGRLADDGVCWTARTIGRSAAASRQSSASLSLCSRANERASPARSPGGAADRSDGSP